MKAKSYDEVKQSFWNGDDVEWYVKWEADKLIDKMKCCGNCINEDNQESSAKCEYCIRYEDNGDEGIEFGDNWEL